MAKIKAPLFSLDATGTLDKNITYKGLKQKHIAQKYSQPGSKNPFESSPRQKDQRSIIRLITIHWQCMSSADKLSWENAAKDVRFKGTGYHYFLHMAQQNLTQYLGLVGYWSMNYNVNDIIPDLSGNSNQSALKPIYPCDCPILVDGPNEKLGKSLSFNGTTNYLYTLDSPSLHFSALNALTIELYFKPVSITGIHALLHSHNGANTGFSIYFYSDGRVRLTLYDGSIGYDIWSTFTLTPGEYCHIVATHDGVEQILYIDGLPHITQNDTFNYADSLGPIHTGRSYWNAYHLHGLINSISLYNSALSPDEILKHYQYFHLS